MTSPRRTRFTLILRLLRWLMAAMILAMLFIGVGMVSTTGPAYVVLLRLHRPLGIAILGLALFRLALRMATGSPPLPSDLAAPQRLAAKGSHLLLYAGMIGMPIIGWAMLSAGGYRVALTQSVALPAILPHDLRAYTPLRLLHTVGGVALFALILLHLSAALVHALIRRDGVFGMMMFGDKRRR